MLIDETEVASRAMPGLVEALTATSLLDLEESGGAAIAGVFRAHGDPAFLIPRASGGTGGSLLEATQILRVVGARCPSLSIMMTMHHHTVATFFHGRIFTGNRARLRQIVEERALVASAFSEGRRVADVLESSVRCERLPAHEGFRMTGSKKPCSMTHHARFAVVGVTVGRDDARRRGIALVDTSLPGVQTSHFWPADILRSADCHCLTFDDVVVPPDCVVAPPDARPTSRERLAVAHAEITMSCLFQVMVSAAYLGMASRVCEMTLERKGGTPSQRVEMLSRLETAVMATYRLAHLLESHECSGYQLAQSMLVARNASAQIEHVVSAGVRALGGQGYLTNREAQYLVLASRCLDFHPPNDSVREQVVEGCYTDVVSAAQV